MSERSEIPSRKFYLTSGFSFTRFVVGSALNALASDLDELSHEDSALEVRWPHKEDDDEGMIDARVGVKVVRRREIQAIQIRDRRIPLGIVYRELDRAIPSIGEAHPGATLTAVYETPPDRQGGRFFAASFDTDTGDFLNKERTSTLDRVIQYAGVPGQSTYRFFTPDTTVAYLGATHHPETDERVLDIVRGHLPLPVDLEAVVKYPSDAQARGPRVQGQS